MKEFMERLNNDPVVKEICTKCGINHLTIANIVEYKF